MIGVLRRRGFEDGFETLFGMHVLSPIPREERSPFPGARAFHHRPLLGHRASWLPGFRAVQEVRMRAWHHFYPALPAFHGVEALRAGAIDRDGS